MKLTANLLDATEELHWPENQFRDLLLRKQWLMLPHRGSNRINEIGTACRICKFFLIVTSIFHNKTKKTNIPIIQKQIDKKELTCKYFIELFPRWSCFAFPAVSSILRVEDRKQRNKKQKIKTQNILSNFCIHVLIFRSF